MSRDIRSYFLSSGGSKKKEDKNKHGDNVVRQKKRQIIVIESDSDDDEIFSQKKKPKATKDEEEKGKKCANTAAKPELKPVNVSDIFGNSQIKRTVAKKSREEDKITKNLPLEDQHSDSDFEATLRQIDTQEKDTKKEKKTTPAKEKRKHTPEKFTPDKTEQTSSKQQSSKKHTPKHTPEKFTPEKTEQVSSKQQSSKKHTHEKEESPGKEKEECDQESSKHSKITSSPNKPQGKKTTEVPIENGVASKYFSIKNDKETNKHTPSKDKETKFKETETKDKETNKHTPNSKKNQLDSSKHSQPEKDVASPTVIKKELDDSFSDDAFEKKRQHAIQYQKYLHREGPKNPGGKEIPEGKPGCLSGLVFVVTGVLETIDRTEATELIQKYGGRITSNVSRNTSYVVVGDEPGPSKIDKATKFNTKQITEDGLLDLIRTSKGSSTTSEGKNKGIKKENKKANAKALNDSMHGSQLKTTHDIKTEDIKEESTKVPAILKKESSILSTPPTEVSSQHHATPPSLWVDKYRPASTKNIIGQQGDKSNVKKLTKWLQNWHSNHSGKKKLVRPSPWAKDDSGSFFKAALLSGPPGVGKTTSAHLVCKELGFDVVEFNASDTRSKKLLHEEVSELLSSKSLSGYFQGAAGKKPTENHVLLMDEVDGMAGNEDRGGVQELIQLIKNSRVPIICMCNDRHHPKIRSLTNYCFDLQFSRPRLEQIRGSMMSICFKEGIKIPPEALNDMINGSNHDIRQILHHMSMWSVKDKHLSVEQAKTESQKAKKNIRLGPWDVLKKVFSADAHKSMSIYDKSDLFFHDYSLGPLFVYENYLSVKPHKAGGSRDKHLELVAKTAESLSSGDIVEKEIRSKNAWSLLTKQAMFSSVMPGHFMEGHLTSQINFPAWLGKNSKRNKFHRLLQELHMHMRLSISGSREAVNLDYLMPIRDSIVGPLAREGSDGVPATLAVMENYYLTREDLDSVLELSLWPNQKDPMSVVDSKVKAALTRAYNKEGFMTPYSIVHIKKTSSKSSQDMEYEEDGEDVVEDEEDKEDISNDAMIKAKKRPTTTREPKPEGSGAKRAKTTSKESKKDDNKKTKKNDSKKKK